MISCMRNHLKKPFVVSRTEHGFTLVEIALVLAVLGLFIGSVVSGIKVQDDGEAMRVTKERQRRVAMALSDFALKYGRLPCSASLANPPATFGLVDNCLLNADNQGVIPFRTLGLSMQDAYDGYGNLMTYQVFGTALNATDPSTLEIHSRCRFSEVRYNAHNPASRSATNVQPYVPPWMVWISIPLGEDTAGRENKNPLKARFCCQRVATSGEDQKIWWQNIGTSIRHDAHSSYSTTATHWGVNVNSAVANFLDLNLLIGSRFTYDAYMLTSHGKNGAGAYIYTGGGPGPIQRVPSPDAAGASIYDTATTSPNNRVLMPYNLNPGPDYYDNIVLWRTQEMTIAESGRTLCTQP